MIHWKSWLLVAVVAVVLEVLPPATHFFFLCVGLGALAAAIVSFFAATSWPAWVVFGLVTVALMPVLMPLAKFLFARRQGGVELSALTNKKATVREAITSTTQGTVSVEGDLWRAHSEGGTFNPGDEVVISRVESDHLIVRRSS